ncbi:DUF6114 domain-containing protein [Streptomyces colonosanans]|uniref:Integral membrane protein n=1 Tax=Streptomyces colonosanans TaxID=1428652 RepID=A0A1S2PYQ1_9ACTN|nr:DUF6114 domain-containing protein [Streptomyces colonosanans]OIJ98580.1 hypothetical protein BIV24_05665 [Streptomyces colonosanans]
MSAESPGQNEHYLRVLRQNFRDWRGTRPFWAGLFVLLGGFPIMYFPYANLQIGHLTLAMATTAGAGSLIIGVLLIVLGISLWFQRHVRTFAGVAAILLALVSIPVSNFGGFLVGFLFALIGGAMAVAWVPGEPEAAPTEPTGSGQGVAPQGGIPQGAVPQGDVPQGVVPQGDVPQGDAPQSAPEEPADGVSGPNDLSETSPANGANGRRSAG